MSAEATFWAWMMGVKPAHCKLVLLCLADCHNSDNGRCDPGGKYIADFTGVDRKTIPDALKRLQLMGLITPHKRPGNSTQYTLHIDENPVPVREKGERKQPVKIAKVSLPDQPQERVYPETGLPVFGHTRKRISGVPENGGGVGPKTGHEPTSNLPVKPTSCSDPCGSASTLANPVDNSLQELGVDYQSPTAGQLIFNRGARFLAQYPQVADEVAARKFLGMCKSQSGENRTLDALVVAMIAKPTGDPKAFILQCLANQPRPLAWDWEPEESLVTNLASEGIPGWLISEARDIFVTWFCEMQIEHNDFPGLFRRWCIADWERAEQRVQQYRQRLARSAGLNYQRPVKFPA